MLDFMEIKGGDVEVILSYYLIDIYLIVNFRLLSAD